MSTKFDSGRKVGPEVDPGVVSLFPETLDGSNIRHPSNPRRPLINQDLIDAGIVPAFDPTKVPFEVHAKAEDALGGDDTRRSAGLFQVGQNTPSR